jgi:excisionase family DNA binding protein
MSVKGLEAVEAQLREIRALLLRQQMMPAAVSFDEAARLLSCSPKHVGRLVRAGELLVTKVGELRRVPLSEIHRITSLPEVGQPRPRARPLPRAAVPESVRLKAMRSKRKR